MIRVFQKKGEEITLLFEVLNVAYTFTQSTLNGVALQFDHCWSLI